MGSGDFVHKINWDDDRSAATGDDGACPPQAGNRNANCPPEMELFFRFSMTQFHQ